MAEKLMRYIQWAQEQGGMIGKVHLAQATKIPSARAAVEPDNAENVKLFREACVKLFQKDPPNF